MAVITGFVEKIRFRNEENGYTVLDVSSEGEEYVVVGTFDYISEGEMISASGTMTVHPIYGEQLQMESYEIKTPGDEQSMERYLASGAIKGIGPALAAKIVHRFKADTFRIIEEEPERLSEIKGISERMAMDFSDQMEEKKELRQAMIFLQNYGISMNLGVKIYNEYGPRMYGIIKENPYQLADDIPGVGFKMADEIAQRVGIIPNSEYRIRSGILYTLVLAAGQGNTYLPKTRLTEQAADLLKVPEEIIEDQLMDMQMDKRIIIRNGTEDDPAVYATAYYYMEMNTARMLHDLNIRTEVPGERIRKRIEEINRLSDIRLDPLQSKAVEEAACSGILIITGGPGTGKTTTINAILRYFEEEDMDIVLAAPTGRAAKRMTEATGFEAKTIHRLLELNGAPSEDGSGQMRFERNESNPLDADVIIIDEMSMVDIQLMQALLKAVNVGTRLIMVGDVNQLPSVGPGNVLKDMISSGAFNVVKLTHIFRQAAQSDIIVNAHRINAGEAIDLKKSSRDFLYIRRESPDAIISAMLTLITDKLPDYVNARPFDIQVLTPMRKGALGVERLNNILQAYLNPSDPSIPEKETGSVRFRVGDKVMQIRNNYQLEWEVRNKHGIVIDSGMGIFNGDMGIIRDINLFTEELTVEFDEGRIVEYPFQQLDELELAYAVTIHKSQGSEYPAVIIPLYSGPKMLMTRNLIYTAVTRARKCVCIVGLSETFQDMVDNETEQTRYSGLEERIMETGII